MVKIYHVSGNRDKEHGKRKFKYMGKERGGSEGMKRGKTKI